MTTSAGSRCVASVDGKELQTRKQFLHTLEQLGGKPGVSYCRSTGDTCAIDEVHAGFLSCSRNTWVSHFGEPENINEHHEFEVRQPLQCWEQQCTEGPVKCVGRMFDRWPDGPWVIVKNVSIPVEIG